MSMVPTTMAGLEGSSSQSRLPANPPRSVEMGEPGARIEPQLLCQLAGHVRAQALREPCRLIHDRTPINDIDEPRWQAGAFERAISHSAIADVFPSPVGISTTRGKSASSRRRRSRVCQRNVGCRSPFPAVNSAKSQRVGRHPSSCSRDGMTPDVFRKIRVANDRASRDRSRAWPVSERHEARSPDGC